MNCPTQNTLISYAANELPPEERKDVSSHLASCPACTEELRFLAGVGANLRSASASSSADCFGEEALCAYVDDALPAERKDAIAKHLISCENCRRQVDEVRLAVAACAGVWTKGAAHKRFLTPFPARIILPLTAAAAVLLIIGILFGQLRKKDNAQRHNTLEATYVALFRGEAAEVGSAMFSGNAASQTYDRTLGDDLIALLQRGALDPAQAASLLSHLNIPDLSGVSTNVVTIRADDRLSTLPAGQAIQVSVQKRLGLYLISLHLLGE